MSNLINAADVANLLYDVLPLDWILALARLQGRARYRYGKNGPVVHDNFTQVFGETKPAEEIERMGRQFFEYERIRSLLISLAPRMSDEALAGLFPVTGEEHLEEALSRGKGAILLGSHLNSIIMLLAIIMWRRRGYDIHVALSEASNVWDRTHFRRARERVTGRRDTLVEAMGGFVCQFNVRPIVRRLQKNQVIAQTGDGWHSARFVEVDFLGRKLPFTTGFWSIAQMTGAAVIPLFVSGAPIEGVRILLDEPVIFSPGAAGELELHDTIARYAKRLEKHLLESIPTWQHWLTPRALDAIAELPRRSLSYRYGAS